MTAPCPTPFAITSTLAALSRKAGQILMASFVPSSLIGDVRGSVGGVTFSRCRSGAVLRARSSPRGLPSLYQTERRAAHSVITDHWRNTLSAANRDTWIELAKQTVLHNKNGLAFTPTGFMLFVRASQSYRHPSLSFPAAAPERAIGPALTFEIQYYSVDAQLCMRPKVHQPQLLDGYIYGSYSYSPSFTSSVRPSHRTPITPRRWLTTDTDWEAVDSVAVLDDVGRYWATIRCIYDDFSVSPSHTMNIDYDP